MNDWLSYKASGSAKNDECLQHAKDVRFKNDSKVSRTYEEMFKTIVSAGEKIRDNYKQMTDANPKDVKSLTDAKKLITSSSKLYSYIAENSNAKLPDPASGWVSKAEFYMNESIEFFGNRCVYTTNVLRNEKTSIEKQRDKFTNAQIRSNYDRRIDALNQSIKTVENMKAEVAGLKHSFEDDSEYLEHWGVKGMKWGHHNQSEQKEKQYEADKRLEAAKAILDAKKTIETAAKEMKRAQDDIGKSLASVNSLTDSYKRAYDRYISAKPEQKDALFNAMTTIYNKLKSETNNLNNLEVTISNNRSIIDNKRLSLNSLGSRMSGADAVMLDNIETDNDLWYDLRDMHKKCTDAQNAASKVLSSHEANVYDKSRVFKR